MRRLYRGFKTDCPSGLVIKKDNENPQLTAGRGNAERDLVKNLPKRRSGLTTICLFIQILMRLQLIQSCILHQKLSSLLRCLQPCYFLLSWPQEQWQSNFWGDSQPHEHVVNEKNRVNKRNSSTFFLCNIKSSYFLVESQTSSHDGCYGVHRYKQ